MKEWPGSCRRSHLFILFHALGKSPTYDAGGACWQESALRAPQTHRWAWLCAGYLKTVCSLHLELTQRIPYSQLKERRTISKACSKSDTNSGTYIAPPTLATGRLTRQHRELELVYQNSVHGNSLATLYTCVDNSSPLIILVEDANHYLFGCFLTSPLKCHKKPTTFSGTGEVTPKPHSCLLNNHRTM